MVCGAGCAAARWVEESDVPGWCSYTNGMPRPGSDGLGPSWTGPNNF